MALVFRWLMRLAGAMIVGVLLVIAGVYYFASRSLPDYDRVVEVAGIAAPVEIIRDNAKSPIFLALRMRMSFMAWALPMRRIACGK